MTHQVHILAIALTACVTTFCLLSMSAARAELGGSGQDSAPDVDQGIAPYTSHNGLSGRLSIAGSDTMNPLILKLATQFRILHPDVQIAVEAVGSNAAIREFQLGHSYQRRGDKVRGKGTEGSNQVEMLASSRELTEEELKGFESNHGFRPTGIPIALDAVALYVHKDNPVRSLTIDQLANLFGQARTDRNTSIIEWSQVGVEGSLAKHPIVRYGRDRRSATRAFFQHVALGGGEFRDDVVEQPGSASEIIAIAQDPSGIGYAGVGFQISSVRMVPIARTAGEPGLWPERAHVSSGAYPLTRPLFLYVKMKLDSALDPMVREFLLFVNSRQGQETVVRASFYPLSDSQVAANLRTLGLNRAAVVDKLDPRGQPALAAAELR